MGGGSSSPTSNSGRSAGRITSSGSQDSGTGSGSVLQQKLGSSDSTTVESGDRTVSEKEVENTYEEHADRKKVSRRKGRDVNERKERLKEVLDEKFEIEEEHMFGSFTRGTLVGPMDAESDTDVMIVLSEAEHKKWMEQDNGAKNCLQALKRAIEKHPNYSQTDVSIDRNVVAVKFHDFTVEIAPAFNHPQGGYVIPDTASEGQSWVRTNPRMYKEMFEAVDESHGGRLQKAARLAKKWKKENDVSVSSYHLEVIVFNHFRTLPDDTPVDEAMEDLFAKLPSKLRDNVNDPAVPEERLDAYMSQEQKQEAIWKSKEARKTTERARRHKKNGRLSKSKKELRKVYGDDFDS